jgi:exonuclease III
LQTTVEVPDGRLTLYNVHFLPYLLLPFELHRWRAAGALLKLIGQQQPGPHLIIGDLNAIGPGDRVLQHLNPPRMRRTMRWQFGLVFKLAIPRLLRAGYVDCFRRLHPHADGFTWYTRGQRTTRYDYILADEVMSGRLCACRVVDEIEAIPQASDHFPLLAEFEMSQY